MTLAVVLGISSCGMTDGLSSAAGGASKDVKKDGDTKETSSVNMMSADGALDSQPTMGALVEVVHRDKMYRKISETMSEMGDKMKSMMDNINNRLEQIEEAGNWLYDWEL